MTPEQEYEMERLMEDRLGRTVAALKRFHTWAEAPENRQFMENVRDGDPLANARYRGFTDEFQRRI